jgi:hypothetical protein
MPVKLLGACTSWPDSGAGLGLVTVVGGGGGGGTADVALGNDVEGNDVEGDGVVVPVAVETAVASSAGQP